MGTAPNLKCLDKHVMISLVFVSVPLCLWHLGSIQGCWHSAMNWQISCPCRFDSGAVCLCGSEKDQAERWEGYLHLCQERSATNWWERWKFINFIIHLFWTWYGGCSCNDVRHLRGEQGWRWFPLHDLQWREYVWDRLRRPEGKARRQKVYILRSLWFSCCKRLALC